LTKKIKTQYKTIAKQGDKMNNKFWSDEMVRLWREGKSLDEARAIVRRMMKEKKREELAK